MKIERVLVAVDESVLGTDVLPVAEEIVRRRQAKLALVSVADLRGVGVTETAPPLEVTATRLREDAASVLDRAAATLEEVRDPLKLVREGVPDREIVAAANDWHADLLVVGTHGRTGLAHWFQGSVAESILHHSPCPVLVVPIGRKVRR